jgi:hypothetical protein
MQICDWFPATYWSPVIGVLSTALMVGSGSSNIILGTPRMQPVGSYLQITALLTMEGNTFGYKP